MTKIHIIGAPGSGKSFIASKLSKRLKTPKYDLDDLFWDKDSEYFGSQTPAGKRQEKLSKILAEDKWIIEGVYYSWLEESFEQADYILVLKTNVYLRGWRIWKRFLLRKLKVIPSIRKENFRTLTDLLKWNHNYDGTNLVQAIKLMKQHRDKVIILTKDKDVFKLLKKRN